MTLDTHLADVGRTAPASVRAVARHPLAALRWLCGGWLLAFALTMLCSSWDVSWHFT
ncbi:hypothetical protein [Klenkia terrae]|uniref:Uncharacterized protein n=1 Tax=Klenkia terrae TaxID=1052259 RepID=A0ABU8E9U1_9ACTN